MVSQIAYIIILADRWHFFYWIVKALVSTDAAVFATLYYLFLPLGILTSRSFQPDSLMMLLFLISLFSIIMYYEKPSRPRLMSSAMMSGLALFVKPLVLFTLLGAFIALAFIQKGTRKHTIVLEIMMFTGVFLLPFMLYYAYGLFFEGFLQSQVQMSFNPRLLLYREYWKGWLQLGTDAVGLSALLGAFLGVLMLPKGLPRALWIGLCCGYLVFGLVFNFHIHTHDYYHLQLIPIVALPLSTVISLIITHFGQLANKWYWWLPILGVFLLLVLFGFREYRGKLGQKVVDAPTAREIGELVNHSSKAVYVSPYYGIALQYYGELTGSYWPREISYWLYRRPGEGELSVEDRLEDLDFYPEYFIITDFSEFNRYHLDLKEYLESNCPQLARSEKYLIYGFCEP